MEPLDLHDWHQSFKAAFNEVNGAEAVWHYGDPRAEYDALRRSAGVLDLGFRGRVCLTGADRVRFLNGQVTNHIAALRPGRGCYAALLNARGKMQSDLHVHCLPDELLLDFEPGRAEAVTAHLARHVVADEVEILDLRPHYGLLSVQGPQASAVLTAMNWPVTLPDTEYQSVTWVHETHGECLIICLNRFGCRGLDVFVPRAALGAVADGLVSAARALGGGVCGWESMEMARVEAGIPRYGRDMDDTTIPLEAGLEERAIRYDKGCYIGQEVINRVHSVGRVTRSLRGLLLPGPPAPLPPTGASLWHSGRVVGQVTSAVESPLLNRRIGLGYVRREVDEAGTGLALGEECGGAPVQTVPLPFVKP